jgi:SPP1 gp7 family putative phage head morphogenesis protein
VDNILLDAFNLKPATAIDYLKRKGYAVSWNWFDTWKDAHAKAFTVAKAFNADVLRDIRMAVEHAIESGKTFEQFKKELLPKLQSSDPKRNWWGEQAGVNPHTGEVENFMAGSPRRLKTIYQTNLQTAYMTGRYKGQLDAAADLPYWQYIAVLDGRTSDTCRDMHGRVFRYDDPIWDSLYPPNHWGCRARVRALTEGALRREGLRVEDSEGRIVERETTVGKGDAARDVTVKGMKLGNGKTFWAGPGWDGNPAITAWMPEVEKYHPLDAQRFIEEGFKGPDYMRFLQAKGKIGGRIPVALLPADIMATLPTELRKKNARTPVAWLSADTLFKNADHHKDINIEDYLRLQQAIDGAQIVAHEVGKPNVFAFVSGGAKPYFAAVKVATKGEGIFVQSYRRASTDKAAEIKAHPEKWVIIKERTPGGD